MKDFYSYIALFDFDEDGISIGFPDLPGCFSCADTYEDAYESAEEALALHLFGLEQDGDTIPKASRLEDIHLGTNQKTALIRVNMRLMKAKIENISIKKTLTIPAYMNIWGEQNNINFSKVLQDGIVALMQENREVETISSPTLQQTIEVSAEPQRNIFWLLPQSLVKEE